MNTLSGADFEIIPTNIICLLTTCEQAHHDSVLPHVLAVPSVTGQPDWQCQKRSGQSRGIKTRRRARCKRKGFNPRATIHHSQSARVYTDKHGSHKSIFPQKTGLSLLCHSWEWQSRLNPEKSKKKRVLDKIKCPYGLWVEASGARRLPPLRLPRAQHL